MNYYIQKDSLLDAIYKLEEHYDEDGWECVSKQDLEDAIRYSVKTVEMEEWIPVEDEVPDVDEHGASEYILLSFANYLVPAVGMYRVDKEGGAFYLGDADEPLVKHGIIVNAWRYLPERYEEG